MLSISNCNSIYHFQGLKKTQKPVSQEVNAAKPQNKKAGKATAVLASFALASTLAGCNAHPQDKSQKTVETTQTTTVSEETTATSANKDSRFGILSGNPFCPHI